MAERPTNTGSRESGSQEGSESHSCYAHNLPYFKDPVHPYDYSEDWDLEEEWNRRQFGNAPIHFKLNGSRG